MFPWGGLWPPVLLDYKSLRPPTAVSRHLCLESLPGSTETPGRHPHSRTRVPLPGPRRFQAAARDSASVSWGARNKRPQSGQLTHTSLFSHRLGARSPRSRCEQGWFLPESLREGASYLFSFGGSRHRWARGRLSLASASGLTWLLSPLFSVSNVPLPPSCKDTCPWT